MAFKPEEFYVIIDGEARGPFSRPQLSEMVANWELGSGALCAQDGDANWKTLREVGIPDRRIEERKPVSAGTVAGLGCLVLVALFVLIPVLAGLFGDSSGEHSSSPSRSDLMEAAHNEVLRYLKAPSTARFNASSESLYRLNGLSNEYLATVVVDAQNSFGAMIRGSYDVRIVANGSSLTATMAQ